MNKKRVGIFGGTFDPVHTGHIEAVHSFLSSHLIDEVWVVLTPDPPHKSESPDRASFQHRLEMLKLAFDGMARVKISTIEKELSRPSYTLQTLQVLSTKYPGHRFFLCIGEDSVSSFHDWHRYKDILNDYSLIAVKRPGSDAEKAQPDVLEKTIFVEHKPVDVSSTGVREGKSGIMEKVPDEIASYIKEHELYAQKRSA
ncbi:MAG: nicotinate (nicotinamide) nucleotide adenylyltransferase [Balneolaceae bacterium]|nr:nicotinate (nicotinamide) nucleotide adenylyltransferase [Balneolaceae bacterium]